MSALAPILLTERSQAADAATFDARFAATPAAVRHPPHATALPPAESWRRLLEFPLGQPMFWLAIRGDAVVGRVGTCHSPTNPTIGYLGFFDVDSHADEADLVANLLLEAACAALRGRGVTRVYGPVDLTTWFSYRYRVPATAAEANEQNEPPFWWEPQNPEAYPRWLVDHGFVEAKRFHSIGFHGDAPGVAEMIVAFTGMAKQSATKKGFSFRPIDQARLADELPVLHRLSMESFADAYLFEPLPLPLFESLYRSTAGRVDLGLSQFVLDPEGQEVGFAFGFIDRGYAVVKTIAVLPAFRGHRLSTALLHVVLAGGLERGVRRGLSALVRAGSTSQFLEGRHALLPGWRHEYALFEKTLSERAEAP